MNNFIDKIKSMNINLYKYNDVIIDCFYDELNLDK